MVLMGHCHCKSPTPKYNPKNGGVEWRIGREAAGRWRALLEARAASLFRFLPRRPRPNEELALGLGSSWTRSFDKSSEITQKNTRRLNVTAGMRIGSVRPTRPPCGLSKISPEAGGIRQRTTKGAK